MKNYVFQVIREQTVNIVANSIDEAINILKSKINDNSYDYEYINYKLTDVECEDIDSLHDEFMLREEK